MADLVPFRGRRRLHSWPKRRKPRLAMKLIMIAALLGILSFQARYAGLDAFGKAALGKAALVATVPAGPVDLVQPRAIDGDTIEDRATGERFRLLHIDTAESGVRAKCPAERAFAERATQEVRRALAGARRVEARRSGQKDRYGRTLADISLDGLDLGGHLLREGLARPWVGRRLPWCGEGGQLLSA